MWGKASYRYIFHKIQQIKNHPENEDQIIGGHYVKTKEIYESFVLKIFYFLDNFKFLVQKRVNELPF